MAEGVGVGVGVGVGTMKSGRLRAPFSVTAPRCPGGHWRGEGEGVGEGVGVGTMKWVGAGLGVGG